MPDNDAPRLPNLEKSDSDVTADVDDDAGDDDTDADDGSDEATDGATDEATDKAATSSEPERRAPLWIETVVLLVVALGMALIIKTFLVQAFYIPSASMEPGLVKNDRILVQKVSYWFGGSPSRGDVVVFEDPGGWLLGDVSGPQTLLAKGLAKIGLYPTGGHLVKRVIGVAGDTIVCCDDEGRLSVNGVALEEDDFIRPQKKCDGPMVNGCDADSDWTVTVPPDRLFVMGDNRAFSADSSDRLLGKARADCDADAGDCWLPKNNPDKPFVPTDLVVGKVFSLVWPLKHATFIGRPDVFDDVPDAP